MNLFRALPVILLLLLFTGLARAQSGPLLQTAYAPPVRKGTVRFYLDDIAQRTGVPLSYSDELVKRRRSVRLRGDEQTVEDVLRIILAGTGVVPAERGGKILLVPASGQTPEALPQSVTISGIIKDSSSREVLIGAYVYIPALNAGTASNAYGFYSLTVPPGKHEIITASGGYRPDTSRINISNDLRRDVFLPYGLSLSGVTVSSRRDAPADHTHLTMTDINAHAGLLGENDVLRALQHIAGVATGTDGTSGMMVRGGDPGQNLNLLDGVPLYYIDHFYGITSVFNSDAVKSVDFYKGAFPSRYGGRLSSIIDVASRDGDMKRFGGSASIGLLKGNLTFEGPVIKNKASFMVSARRTWIDALWRPFLDEVGVDFYDINAKTNYIINKNNRVYASFYTGRDQFRARIFGEESRTIWGNTIGAARWTSIINPRLFINTTATYSYFRYSTRYTNLAAIPDSSGVSPNYSGNSTVKDAALRVQADYFPSAKHHIQAGIQYANAGFSPATATYAGPFSGGPENTIAAEAFRSHEIIAYAEDEWKLAPRWTVRAGMHLANWISTHYNYSSLQPRLYLTWRPDARQLLFASGSRMSQFLHQLNSNTSSLPVDFWVPSTSLLKPENAWLYAIGYNRKISRMLEATAEIYYKDIRNLVTYRTASTIFENSLRWDESLTQGKGWSYGAELSARAKAGPLTLTAAYTLSRTWRQFSLLNGGEKFPYRFDRRHNGNIELVYQRTKRFRAIAGWTYMTGEAVTLPDQAYPDFDNNILGSPDGTLTYHYSARNNYRLPEVHRLDLAVHFIRQRGPRYERTWTLGLFNAYGRRNVIAIELVGAGQGEPARLEGISLFRYIPTISYSVKF